MIPFGQTSATVNLAAPVATNKAFIIGENRQASDWPANSVARYELVDTNGTPDSSEAVRVTRGGNGGNAISGDMTVDLDIVEFLRGATVQHLTGAPVAFASADSVKYISTSGAYNRSFALVSQSSTAPEPDRDGEWNLRAKLMSDGGAGTGNQLELSRDDTGSTAQAAVQIVTFDDNSGVTVQSGTVTVNGSATVDYLDKSGDELVFFSTSTAATTAGLEGKYRVRTTMIPAPSDNDNPKVQFSTAINGSAKVTYFVVSIPGAQVQNGTQAFNAETVENGANPQEDVHFKNIDINAPVPNATNPVKYDPKFTISFSTASGGDATRNDRLGDTSFTTTLTNNGIRLERADRSENAAGTVTLEAAATVAWTVMTLPNGLYAGDDTYTAATGETLNVRGNAMSRMIGNFTADLGIKRTDYDATLAEVNWPTQKNFTFELLSQPSYVNQNGQRVGYGSIVTGENLGSDWDTTTGAFTYRPGINPPGNVVTFQYRIRSGDRVSLPATVYITPYTSSFYPQGSESLEDANVRVNPMYMLGGGVTEYPTAQNGLIGAWTGMMASAAHGDVVFITPGWYNPTQDQSWFVNTIEPLLTADNIPNRVTSFIVSPFMTAAQVNTLTAAIDKAEIVYFFGGDQSIYVDALYGTAAIAKLNDRIAENSKPPLTAKPITVGGTSAGMAILGGLVYRNEPTYSSSLESDTFLNNANHPGMTFVKDFIKIPGLETTITDTHFQARERQGRLLVFLGRLATDANASIPGGRWVPEGAAVQAIASDERTFTIIKPFVNIQGDLEQRIFRLGTGRSHFYKTRPGYTFTVAANNLPSSGEVDVTVNPDQNILLADAFGFAGKTRRLKLTSGVIDPGPYYGD